MKRLVPILVLLAFWLQLSDGSRGRPFAGFPLRTCTQDSLNFSALLPADTLLDQCDQADQSSAPPDHSSFRPEPSQKRLLLAGWVSPPSQKQFSWLGLGCGALPS